MNIPNRIYTKVRVRGSEDEDIYRDRYPVMLADDGGIFCVDVQCEQEYLNDEQFTTTRWDRWEEIPEPKMRDMTRDEIILFILDNPRILVRVGEEKWSIASRWIYDALITSYEYMIVPEDYSGNLDDLPVRKFVKEV